MSVPISEKDLAAIGDRAAAATPGPWYWGPEHPEFSDVFGESDFVVSRETPLMQFEPSRNGAADAEFVAYARQDVPALLAEVDRLRAELAAMAARPKLCCEFHNNRSNGLPCDGACCHDCCGLTGSGVPTELPPGMSILTDAEFTACAVADGDETTTAPTACADQWQPPHDAGSRPHHCRTCNDAFHQGRTINAPKPTGGAPS